MSGRHSRDHGIDILCLDDLILIIFMDNRFLRCYEPGSHLDSLSSQHEGRCHSSAIGDTSGRDHRDRHRIHHLRHQCHGCGGTDMSAALHAFRHYGVCSCPLHHLRHSYTCHHRDDLHSGIFPQLHEFSGVSRTCRYRLYSFFHNDLRYFFCVGIEQHDIHAEGLVGQLFAFTDFLPDDLRRSGSGTDDTKASGIRYRCRQLMFRHPCHASLENGIFDL